MTYLFSIPDSSRVRIVNGVLLSAMIEHQGWFYDDFKIDVAYGCPPNCIWNGGRVEGGRQFCNSELIELFAVYKNYNVKYRVNFTNLLLKAEHLTNEYGNIIARELSSFNGGVTVTLPIMGKYIEKNYPSLDVVWSTSADYGNSNLEMIKKINMLSEKNIVVLPFDFNNTSDIDLFVHPGNLEILICDECYRNCPMRKKHNYQTSKITIDGLTNNGIDNNCMILQMREEDWAKSIIMGKDFSNTVGRSKLSWYYEKGINRFKLSGRENIEKVLAEYNYYFVKPQHYEDFYECVCNYIKQNLANITIIDIDQLISRKGYDRVLGFLRSYGGLI